MAYYMSTYFICLRILIATDCIITTLLCDGRAHRIIINHNACQGQTKSEQIPNWEFFLYLLASHKIYLSTAVEAMLKCVQSIYLHTYTPYRAGDD